MTLDEQEIPDLRMFEENEVDQRLIDMEKPGHSRKEHILSNNVVEFQKRSTIQYIMY